jgi:hypothetical protein
MAGISFKAFHASVRDVIEFPVLIRGAHGIGKSEVVYAFARDTAYDEETGRPVVLVDGMTPYSVVERRASQMTEGDLIGMPDANPDLSPILQYKTTAWCAPDWLVEACEKPVLLFLDEVDRATTEVRQGLFELADSRKIYGKKLHKGTMIFAAVNGGQNGDAYQVNDMDPAELDRWTVFDVDPTVEDWLNWAKDDGKGNRRISPVIYDFIVHNNGHLEHNGAYDPKNVYPSRRSWDRLDRALKLNGLIDDVLENKDAHIVRVVNIATGFVGFEAAMSFSDHIRKYKSVVKFEDILDRGKFELTKDFLLNDHLAMIDKMDAAKVFESNIPEARMKNLCEYFVSLPSEIGMKLTDLLMAKDTLDVSGKDGDGNIRRFMNTETSKGLTHKIFVEVLLGEQSKKENEDKSE